jgi:ABC-2 type transport system permease protein
VAPADDQGALLQAEVTLSRISPLTLFSESSTLLLDPTERTVDLVTFDQVNRAIVSDLTLTQSLLVVWPQIVGMIALTAALFAIAYVLFMRQEVRA